MRNFCPAAGSFNSFSRELALSQKSKITKPLSAMIFFKLCANFAIHHSVCVVNILLHKGSKSIKKLTGRKKIDTPPCYLYPLRPGVTFTYKSLWRKCYCYYYCFGDYSLYRCGWAFCAICDDSILKVHPCILPLHRPC